MGCTSSTNQGNRKTELPMTYYLNRKESCVLTLKGKKIIRQNLDPSLKLPVDSAVVLTKEKVLYVAGGTDPTEGTCGNFLMIELDRGVIKHLPAMPVPAKNGHLIEYNASFFYVGGCTDENEPSPMMKFDTISKEWENIGHMVDLFQPGVFLLQHKIYFIGGEKLDTREANSDVYSLNLYNFDLRLEDFKLPVGVNYPMCAGGKHKALIVVKSDVFRLDIDHQVRKMPSLPWEITENYPIELTSGRIVVYSFPKAGLIYAGETSWKSYDLGNDQSAIEIKDEPFNIEHSPQFLSGHNPLVGQRYQDHSSSEDENQPMRNEIDHIERIASRSDSD